MILICFGTRPEYIKIKPLLKAFDGNIPYKLLFTGQHKDLLSHVKGDIRRLEIEDGANRLDSIVSSIMNNNDIFQGIDSVLVQGDTTSVFSLALAAFHRKIKVIHLEAGLRTYDINNPYPEELNRQMTSRIANIHLCPTQEAHDNLIREKVLGQKFVVGNTVLDNLVDKKVSYKDKIIVTMHRRENHYNMDKWFKQIDLLAKENSNLQFMLPIHPNPNVKKHQHLLKYVKVVPPMDYANFIDELANCRFIITDSGGIQEESSFLRKKCIVCRKTTERVEGMGTFSTLVMEPLDLKNAFDWANKCPVPDESEPCPYGDGQSAEKILRILKDYEV
mgnify:CR=1 FL=1|tara:strand:- start:966 stop:1964 length:999 start_codon:yes stop_codon:yes gene_type:complete